jgi:hypothetical protein
MSECIIASKLAAPQLGVASSNFLTLMHAHVTHANMPNLEDKIDHNLQIAIECMDAELARRIREHNMEIRELRSLQSLMFNSFADRNVPDSVKNDIKALGI